MASQPALTLGDALISLSLGVTLYNESVRTGWWLAPETVGVGLVLLGAVGLSRLETIRQSGGAAPRTAPSSGSAGATGPAEAPGAPGSPTGTAEFSET